MLQGHATQHPASDFSALLMMETASSLLWGQQDSFLTQLEELREPRKSRGALKHLESARKPEPAGVINALCFRVVVSSPVPLP